MHQVDDTYKVADHKNRYNNVVINQSHVPEFEGQIPLAVKTEQLAVTSHTIVSAFIMFTCCYNHVTQYLQDKTHTNDFRDTVLYTIHISSNFMSLQTLTILGIV